MRRAPEEHCRVDLGVGGANDDGVRSVAPEPVTELRFAVLTSAFGYKVQLVQHQDVRRCQLAGDGITDVFIFGPGPHRLPVDNHDDGVEGHTGTVTVRCNSSGVSNATGLDDEAFRLRFQLSNGVQRRGEAVDEAATDTAVGQRHRVAVFAFDERLVNIDVPKVVDQHRNPRVRGSKNVVDQRGLARAEIPTDHGDGNLMVLGNAW